MVTRRINPYTRASIQSAVTQVPSASAGLAAAQEAFQGLNLGNESSTSIGGFSYPDISAPATSTADPGTSIGGFSYPTVPVVDFGARYPEDNPNAFDYDRPADFDSEQYRVDNEIPDIIRDFHTGDSLFQNRQDQAVADATRDRYNDLLGSGGLSPEEQMAFDRAFQDIDREAARAEQDYSLRVADLESQRDDMLQIYGIKSPYLDARIQREQQQWELQQQEYELRRQRAAEDVQRTQRTYELTGANREALSGVYGEYRGIMDPLIANAIEAAGGFFEQQREGSLAIESNENEALYETFRDGVGETLYQPATELDGLSQAALSAALEEVNFGRFELAELSQARARGDENVARATEPYLVAEAESFGASDRASLARRAALSDANFDVREEDALNAVTAALQSQQGLETNIGLAELGFEGAQAALQENREIMDANLQQGLSGMDRDLSRLSVGQQRVLEDLITARERLGEDRNAAEISALGELAGMDANQYGELQAETYLEDALSGYTPGRQEAIAGTFLGLLDLNITSGAEAAEQLDALVLDGELDRAEASIISNALDQFGEGRSTWDAGAIQGVFEPRQTITSADRSSGKVGQAPGGEAYDNIGNRDHPDYVARANFVSQNKQQVMDQFGLEDWGQWRDVDAALTENRSPTSDHYSGGANDYFGSADQMQRAKTYLENQPYVSFAKIHEPGPHLHVSYKLGAG